METQLHLVVHRDDTTTEPARPDWQIDDASKARGRAGLALARAALAQARLRRPPLRSEPGGHPTDRTTDHTTAA